MHATTRRHLFPFLLSIAGFMALALTFARAQPTVQTQQNVTTYMFDNYQSGVNANETVLRPSNVTSGTFGALFSSPIDGQAYAQPLYLSNITVNGAQHNVAYVATMHDSVYAFDADTGATLWQDSFISASGSAVPLITTVPATDLPGSGNSDVNGSEVGIESTPVIDPSSGTIYVVAKTKETGRGDGNIHYVQRMHALDVATGAEKFNGPKIIGDATCNNSTASPGTFDFNLTDNPQTPSVATSTTTADNYVSGRVYLNALRNLQRCSLTLYNGVVYVAWASHGDSTPYHGWLVGFGATTLLPVANLIFCDTPDGSKGGIWQSGAGPTIDNNGNLFISTANAPTAYNANQTTGDVAESFLKFNPANGLSVTAAGFDFWAPGDAPSLGNSDSGVGSGGLVLIDVPGTTITHLCMAGGKNGKIYVVNRDNMGHFINGGGDNDVQTFLVPNRSFYFGCPVFFNDCLFFDGSPIQGLTFNPSSSTFTASGTTNYGFTGRGGGLVISANGTANGIIWSFSGGVLEAVRPESIAGASAGSSVASFYNTPLGDRSTVKFTHPIVINGKVYAANMTAFLGYGLLNATLPTVTIAATQATATVGGQAGTLTITRAGTTVGNLLINYTVLVSSTARSGTDYTAVSGTATIFDGASTATVTISPLTGAVNNATVNLQVSASSNYTVGTSSQATVTISDPAAATNFASWQQTHFGAQAGSASAAPNADFDHDGLANILEYALGTDPTKNQPAPYTVSVSSNRMVIAFHRVVPPDPNLIITVSASNTLAAGSWTALATKTGTGAWVVASGAAVTDNVSTGAVTVTDSQTASTSYRFLRISASYMGN